MDGVNGSEARCGDETTWLKVGDFFLAQYTQDEQLMYFWE